MNGKLNRGMVKAEEVSTTKYQKMKGYVISDK